MRWLSGLILRTEFETLLRADLGRPASERLTSIDGEIGLSDKIASRYDTHPKSR
jgi:hypothetical protein